MLTETFSIYGQPESPVELIPLRAGPLTMLYEPRSGMLRRIKLGEHEVVRGIYAAVRDHNWGTVPAKVRETVRSIGPHSFHLNFESAHQRDDIHFVWRGVIRGEADGTLRYEFDGEAKLTFMRNRMGFCVLHPIRECAGGRARQTRTDGSVVECRFPELIEPQIIGRASFRDLRGVAHEVADELWAEIEFEGDTFEMEDQRNWTDASFKTYCTPQALPFPVEIASGARVRQAVTMRLSSRRREEAKESDVRVASPPHVWGSLESAREVSELTLTIPDAPTSTLPRIGLESAGHGESLGETEIRVLRQLHLSHLRVDIRLAARDWASSLSRAAHDAEVLGARLEIALHLPPEGEVDSAAVTPTLERHAAALLRVLALREDEPATSVATLNRVRKLLGPIRVPVGCGSDRNFCELNREHALGSLGLLDSDFVFWSVNPQVHAFDHLSIMETLPAQAATARSARTFAGNRPCIISPVTLKQRFNPVATGAASPTPPGELPSQVDSRQLSQFAAAWTLGSIAALTSAGVQGVTYFQTTGWRGVMELASGCALPEKFPSRPGSVFPVFDVFAQLAGFSQVAVVPTSRPEELCVLALFAESQLKLVLIANLTPANRRVRLDMPGLTTQDVSLSSYGLVRI